MTISVGVFLGRLGLALGGLLIALIIGEAAVRFAVPLVPNAIDERLVTSGAYQEDAVLGWRPRPNVTQHSQRFNVTFTTNSRGLRDREHRLDRSPGVRRILVLGDSFAWGYGVNDHEIFPRILESQLDQTEVVNLGVTAFGLPQELDYLKLEGILYRPDIVILALCQNDIFRDGLSPQEKYRALSSPPRPRPAPSGLLGAVKEWLAQHVVLYKLAQQAINKSPMLVKGLVALGLRDEPTGFDGLDDNLMPALQQYPPRLQSSFETTEAELLQMRDWLSNYEVRFVVVLIPALQAIEPRAFHHSIAYTVFEPSDFELEKPYRRLEAFARAHGIEIINTYPSLKRRREAGATLYLRNDVHFNAAGHDAFAAEITAYLERSQ